MRQVISGTNTGQAQLLKGIVCLMVYTFIPCFALLLFKKTYVAAMCASAVLALFYTCIFTIILMQKYRKWLRVFIDASYLLAAFFMVALFISVMYIINGAALRSPEYILTILVLTSLCAGFIAQVHRSYQECRDVLHEM